MQPRHLILALACATTLAASAIPAKYGTKRTYTQPDGTEITLRVTGDERRHYYLTDDDVVVIAHDNKYCYAAVDASGRLYNTNIIAHEAGARTEAEMRIVDNNSREKVHRAFSVTEAAGPMLANSHDGVGLFSSATYPTHGNVKALVFLVEYSDVAFREGSPEYFQAMINEEGFSQNGGTGSCRDYFVENSNGQFIPEFDIYGPVVLPNPRSYYGGNNTYGNDSNPQYMMLHAAQLLNEEVDFSQYDTDGDGYVDNVYIFYAGEGEASGGPAESVWPHSWDYSFNTRFDGVKFRRYACGPELAFPDQLDGVGTFTHEFGHVLGLPDLYNTEDANVNYTPCYWDNMDQGCYNNDGCTPPALSAFERNAVGWMGDNLIEITGPATVSLPCMPETNKAYCISTGNSNEFFILENRQQTGWDTYLPYHGMLIWHIDYNTTQWRNNTVNNNGDHQYVDLVEACNRNYSTNVGMRRYPFPGTNKVTKYIFGGSPSFQTWNGTNLGLDITDIKEVDGVITFNVAGGGADPDGISDITSAADCSYNVNGRSISVNGKGALSVTDLTGRVITTGHDAINTPTLTPGIYIVATPTMRTKVIVR